MFYNNPQVYDLSFPNIGAYFTSFYTAQYSPINTLLYGIIYQIAGFEPIAYHLMSLLLHAANTILVFVFVKQLFLLKKPDGISSIKESSLTAFFVALLFGIHPTQVEAVAWISASKVLLYSLFFLLSLWQYLLFVQKEKLRNYLFAILYFIISFGAKEQTVVLPVCLGAIDFYLNRGVFKKKILLEKLPFFLLALGMGIVSLYAQQSGFSDKLAYEYYPLWQRIFLACYSASEYLIKLAIPLKFWYYYPFPMQPHEALPLRYLFYPAVIVALGYYLFLFWKRGYNYILFGAAFFFINLALSLHIIPMARGMVMADRYAYLSSIGFFFIFVLAVNKIGILRFPKFSWQYYTARLSLLFYFLYLGIHTFWYASQWQDFS